MVSILELLKYDKYNVFLQIMVNTMYLYRGITKYNIFLLCIMSLVF